MMMNNSPATEATDSKNHYSVPADRATPSCLDSHFRKQFANFGPIPFDQWMRDCLYHPLWGYYTKGAERVGRAGDFFTSVSVGQCFGMLLAHRIAKLISTIPSQSPFDIIELGANTGQLARDVLDTLRADFPAYYAKTNYTIAEHLPQMQAIQRDTLAEHLTQVSFIPSLESIGTAKPHGVLLSNELIDAFPVKLITFQQGAWKELMVEFSDEAFTLVPKPLSTDELHAFTQTLPAVPEGYTTEFRPGLEKFTQSCKASIQQGLILTIDYGYTSDDFYAAHRKTGTLRTFYQHKAGEDPLTHLGEQDITAHVDFTQLSHAFEKAGCQPSYFNTQSRYLIEHAKDWFAMIESSGSPPPAKLIRQFQTLTHPTMMGAQFSVLECLVH